MSSTSASPDVSWGASDETEGKAAADRRTQAMTSTVDAPAWEQAWLGGERPEPATAIILAGGKSRRMGRDKARLSVAGRPLLESACDVLRSHFDEVIVSVAAGAGLSHVHAVRTVEDVTPGLGPLGGVYASLRESSSRVNFVVACDTPHIELSLVRRLLACSPRFDVAAPAFEGREPEPLFAMYTKAACEPARRLLEGGLLRMAGLLAACRTQVIQAGRGDWYRNLNTQQDLRRYEKDVARSLHGDVGGHGGTRDR